MQQFVSKNWKNLTLKSQKWSSSYNISHIKFKKTSHNRTESQHLPYFSDSGPCTEGLICIASCRTEIEGNLIIVDWHDLYLVRVWLGIGS